jgi:hypothetical protein
MATTEQLGVFDLTSPKVVVIDPGYTLDTAELRYGGCFVCPCRTGTWSVEVEIDTPTETWWGKLPRLLKATAPGYSEISDASDWQQVSEEIGQDGGVIGLFDVARFQDPSVIPSGHEIRQQESAGDPRQLWYRFVCEILAPARLPIDPLHRSIEPLLLKTISSQRPWMSPECCNTAFVAFLRRKVKSRFIFESSHFSA